MRQAGSPGSGRLKRLYQRVSVAQAEGGFTVQLDGRSVTTPVGAALALPTQALAELVAEEWDAQGEYVDPLAMSATRLASTVIDRTAAAGRATAAEVARYAASDVLCYFAEGPSALVEAERAAWRPWLAWAARALGVRLLEVAGVAPQPQPPEALVRVETLVAALEPFAQAGVAYATPLFGSVMLALAVQRGALDALDALEVSRTDEAFQAQRWGIDDEAARALATHRREAAMLGRWFEALAGGKLLQR
jgi:chaperone required for assembly of F1-ATPase